jgi:hypothetical protein
MAENYALVIEGLDQLQDFAKLPQDIIQAARIAVNFAATRGRTSMANEVLNQVNLPRDYVAPAGKRLYVSKNARNNDLEAVVTARARATSLARFAKENSPTRGKAGVRVEVHKGTTRTLDGAFLIRLRAGSGTDTKSNLGLAMRTKNGLAPRRAYAPKKLGNGLWLLYGPSVSQLIYSARNGGGVATDLTPDIQDKLEAEFYRQMEL